MLSAFVLFSAFPKEKVVERDFHLHESKSTVNINTAEASEIAECLDGIGEVLAQRIVDYREKNGPFKEIEELLYVEGIGEKKLEEVKGKIEF